MIVVISGRNFAHDVADVLTANGIYCYLFSDSRPTPELSFALDI